MVFFTLNRKESVTGARVRLKQDSFERTATYFYREGVHGSRQLNHEIMPNLSKLVFSVDGFSHSSYFLHWTMILNQKGTFPFVVLNLFMFSLYILSSHILCMSSPLLGWLHRMLPGLFFVFEKIFSISPCQKKYFILRSERVMG